MLDVVLSIKNRRRTEREGRSKKQHFFGIERVINIDFLGLRASACNFHFTHAYAALRDFIALRINEANLGDY